MAKDFYIKAIGPRGNKTYEVYRRGGGQEYYSDNRGGASRYMSRLQKELNEIRREQRRRRNPPARNSVRLTNFTGKIARLASGQIQVHGVQLKKPNPSRRKRK